MKQEQSRSSVKTWLSELLKKQPILVQESSKLWEKHKANTIESFLNSNIDWSSRGKSQEEVFQAKIKNAEAFFKSDQFIIELLYMNEFNTKVSTSAKALRTAIRNFNKNNDVKNQRYKLNIAIIGLETEIKFLDLNKDQLLIKQLSEQIKELQSQRQKLDQSLKPSENKLVSELWNKKNVREKKSGSVNASNLPKEIIDQYNLNKINKLIQQVEKELKQEDIKKSPPKQVTNDQEFISSRHDNFQPEFIKNYCLPNYQDPRSNLKENQNKYKSSNYTTSSQSQDDTELILFLGLLGITATCLGLTGLLWLYSNANLAIAISASATAVVGGCTVKAYQDIPERAK